MPPEECPTSTTGFPACRATATTSATSSATDHGVGRTKSTRYWRRCSRTTRNRSDKPRATLPHCLPSSSPACTTTITGPLPSAKVRTTAAPTRYSSVSSSTALPSGSATTATRWPGSVTAGGISTSAPAARHASTTSSTSATEIVQ